MDNIIEKKLILIVDDDDSQCLPLKKALEKHQYSVEIRTSGESCLEFLDNRKPDAILLDIVMPEMDGLTTLSTIRKKFGPHELPVFMATAKSNDQDVLKALRMQANDYFIKPIHFDIAQARIETHLKLSELNLQAQEHSKMQILATMIATYNHEVNNPLAIAIGVLQGLKTNASEADASQLKKAEQALWRISEIMKKIQKLKSTEAALTESYSQHTDIYKLRD